MFTSQCENVTEIQNKICLKGESMKGSNPNLHKQLMPMQSLFFDHFFSLHGLLCSQNGFNALDSTLDHNFKTLVHPHYNLLWKVIRWKLSR